MRAATLRAAALRIEHAPERGGGIAPRMPRTRQADHRLGEAADDHDNVVESERAAGRLADDGGNDVEVAAKQRVERGQGVADGATIAAGHQDERQFQRHHHVKDGAVLVERRHDAAYALDQQDFAALLERALAIFHHAVDIDAAALALRRQVRRERGAKTPRRNPLDLLRRQRKSQRTARCCAPGRVSIRPRCRRDRKHRPARSSLSRSRRRAAGGGFARKPYRRSAARRPCCGPWRRLAFRPALARLRR